MSGLTAWRALVTRERLAEGESVIVGAASSGVGTAAIQIAAASGARVVAVTASQAWSREAMNLGATAVADRTSAGFAKQLDASNEGGADLALDPTGKLWSFFVDARVRLVASWWSARWLHLCLRNLMRRRTAATHAIEGTFGRVLVSTLTTTHLAEVPRRGARGVVISYPSRQEADCCCWSSEYQRLLPDRMAFTTPHVALLVDLIPEQGLRIEQGPSRDAEAHRLLTAAARWARRWGAPNCAVPTSGCQRVAQGRP